MANDEFSGEKNFLLLSERAAEESQPTVIDAEDVPFIAVKFASNCRRYRVQTIAHLQEECSPADEKLSESRT